MRRVISMPLDLYCSLECFPRLPMEDPKEYGHHETVMISADEIRLAKHALDAKLDLN